MNRSKMATKELLQLAGADLLGILEPDERERFEQAFLEADPAVQATVQMEQAKAAESLLATLPHVDPPMRLKDEVLQEVLSASGQQSPLKLAGAGDTPVPATRPVASEDHWRDAPMRAGTSRYWRAACLALVGLSLALTVLYFDARDSVDNLWGLLNRESHRTWETRVIREAGLPFSELQLLPDTVTVRFQDVAGGDLRAALTFNESRGKAFLEARGLSEGSDYELCYVLEEDQQQTFVHRFKNDGQVETFELASVSLPANGHWEIREAGSSEALLLA
jgi:hypothetical protein